MSIYEPRNNLDNILIGLHTLHKLGPEDWRRLRVEIELPVHAGDISGYATFVISVQV